MTAIARMIEIWRIWLSSQNGRSIAPVARLLLQAKPCSDRSQPALVFANRAGKYSALMLRVAENGTSIALHTADA
jgi:hypothetical protein